MISMRIYGQFERLAERAESILTHIHQSVGKALHAESRGMRDTVRWHVGARLKVAKKGFLKSFSVKVLDQDPLRLPGMVIRSRVPWSGTHERGITIGGKMLIPLHGRVGRKAFKRYVSELIQGGNAYFIKKNGKTILMAENITQHSKVLSGFKRRYRKAEGIQRLKRGEDIPIAILVTKVTLRKRLDLRGIVEDRIPAITQAISRRLKI